MSVQEIKIPDLGVEGAVEVIEINVAAGDRVAVDDTLVVLESDKASLEVPAPMSGRVECLNIKLGDQVKQGDSLLSLIMDEEAVEAMSSDTGQSKIELNVGLSEEPALSGRAYENSASVNAGMLLVTVPDLGSDAEAEVIEVVAVGAELAIDGCLVVLESDKASMEIPTPQAGKVLKLYAKVGDKLKQGDKVAEMQTLNDTSAQTQMSADNDTSYTSPLVVAENRQSASVSHSTLTAQSVHAGPAVRRIAREFGIDLSEVRGSGPKTRILKEDLANYTKARLSGDNNLSLKAVAPLPEIDFRKFGETESIARSRIQKLSAKNLLRNWNSIPHVTQFDEADITELESFRRAEQEKSKKEGVKLTLLAFLLKAVVNVLKKYPDFNSSLDNQGEHLIRKYYYHIGVAVETAEGLVVPVVRDVDQKGVKALASELQQLAEKAREKKLKPAEMQGASFTISSLGGLGGTAFTPIVNYPEVAILGVSRSSLKPVYVNAELQPRLYLPLSLSYDHRVIDGAAAARFTRELASVLSDIRQLVL